MSEFFHGLQAILGTDKKNPMFAVFRDPKKSELHVYYGLELLEVVPDDKTSARFRLMVAQLYNAGVKGLTLIEVFDVDPKSMRKWGRALKSGDPEVLVKALQCRGPRKLTPEIKAYIKRRFPILFDENPRNYGARIRQEILEIFNLQISGEGLRLFFNELKEQHQAKLKGEFINSNIDNNNQESEQILAPPEESTPTPPGNPEEEDPPHPTQNESHRQNASQSISQAEKPSAKKGALAV